jgi:hypothetical protein
VTGQGVAQTRGNLGGVGKRRNYIRRKTMPCYDPDSSFRSIDERTIQPLREKLERTEAMLCAIIKVLVASKAIIPVVEAIDTEEAGVTPNDIAVWWLEHKAKDEERKRNGR